MNGEQRVITMLLGGASDALCLEVSANLARALDRDPNAARGNADWWVETGDGGGQPFLVEVSRVPFEREDRARRRSLLAVADVAVVVVDATHAAIPIAIAGLTDVRAGLGDRPCPVLVFGISGGASGLDSDELRRQLELGARDVVLVGPSSDRARLRQMFVFALRAALSPDGSASATAPAATAPVAAPVTAPPATAGAQAAGPAALGGVTFAPPAPNPVAPAEVQVFGADDAYIEAVLHPDAVSEHGSVQIGAAHWAALGELIGELALIRGSGDVRRESLMRDLLSAGLIVDRRALAGANEAGEVDLSTPPRAPTPMREDPTAPTASGGQLGPLDADRSADDRFRALKELRRQLLG